MTYKIVRPLVVAVLLLTTSGLLGQAAAPKRIALLPFKMNAAKDLTFLQNGIFDMLSSRLTKPGKTVVLSRSEIDQAVEAAAAPVNDAVARRIGNTLNADYVVFGSLTQFGSSVSLDAKMVAVSGDEPPLVLSNQSMSMDGVIPAIDRFATDMTATVLGEKPPARAAAPAAPIAPAAPPAASAEGVDPHAHPDKLIQNRTQEDSSAGDSPFIDRQAAEASAASAFWKSRYYPYAVNGVAVADVDGDGLNETVIGGDHQVIVYRYADEHFTPVYRLEKDSSRFNIAVDAADIDGNGRAEIFVTALNRFRRTVVSYVLEVDGQRLKEMTADQSWYFRVVDTPDRGPVLFGQQHRFGEPYAGRIYELNWQGSELTTQRWVKTPDNVNVMGLAVGDVREGGEIALVVSRFNRVTLASPLTGSIEYASDEKYGGSSLYISGDLQDTGEVENKVWLPMRIALIDVPERNGSLVVVADNEEFADMKWARREFTGGAMTALAWQRNALAPVWTTRQRDGFIRDFQVADFDNDGADELLTAVIVKSGAVVLTRPKSNLIAYELSRMPRASQ